MKIFFISCAISSDRCDVTQISERTFSTWTICDRSAPTSRRPESCSAEREKFIIVNTSRRRGEGGGEEEEEQEEEQQQCNQRGAARDKGENQRIRKSSGGLSRSFTHEQTSVADAHRSVFIYLYMCV